jgi:hypothetical protein
MNVYRFNRTAGTYTAADIKATAWAIYAASIREFMCSTYSDVRVPRHDQRYKFNREAEQAARDIVRAKGFAGIQSDREKHRARVRARVEDERRPANWLALPIVRDYRENRHHLRRVCADRLDFSGRNHWAKDDRDRRILAVLAKGFARYQESREA